MKSHREGDRRFLHFPNVEFHPGVAPITDAFLAKKISCLHEAIHYVWNLPYGRNVNRADYKLVLTEERGTCSAKHALLAQLAKEHEIDFQLTVGFFEMSGSNTPGTGEVLSRYGLNSILEAHCYIKYQGHFLDVTSTASSSDASIPYFDEHAITPDQIGVYKEQLHRDQLSKWLQSKKIDQWFSLDEIWKIREQCILALSEPKAKESVHEQHETSA